MKSTPAGSNTYRRRCGRASVALRLVASADQNGDLCPTEDRFTLHHGPLARSKLTGVVLKLGNGQAEMLAIYAEAWWARLLERWANSIFVGMEGKLLVLEPARVQKRVPG